MYKTQYPPTGFRQSRATNPSAATATIDVGAHQSICGRRVEAEPAHATRRVAPDPARLAIGGRIALSLDYMKAHLNEPIRISTLCAMTGYSQSRFFDVFKTATGDTPLNWFIRARMRWAAQLLESSGSPVQQIAWQVGYGDQFYFSRLFKSVHGVSPSEYRAQKTPIAADCSHSARV